MIKPTIEQIKWMVEKADGFSWGYSMRCHWVIYSMREQKAEETSSNWYLWPLLLQRAIEGVNRDNSYYEIYSPSFCQYEVYLDGNLMDGWTRENIDEAKFEALMYIMEKENES